MEESPQRTDELDAVPFGDLMNVRLFITISLSTSPLSPNLLTATCIAKGRDQTGVPAQRGRSPRACIPRRPQALPNHPRRRQALRHRDPRAALAPLRGQPHGHLSASAQESDRRARPRQLHVHQPRLESARAAEAGARRAVLRDNCLARGRVDGEPEALAHAGALCEAWP